MVIESIYRSHFSEAHGRWKNLLVVLRNLKRKFAITDPQIGC